MQNHAHDGNSNCDINPYDKVCDMGPIDLGCNIVRSLPFACNNCIIAGITRGQPHTLDSYMGNYRFGDYQIMFPLDWLPYVATGLAFWLRLHAPLY